MQMSIELGELAVKKAIAKGASEAEAFVQKSSRTLVEFSDEIENLKVIESLGINVRVALGKRIAMHSTSILSEKEIKAAVDTAISIAKAAPEDPSWTHLNIEFGKTPVKGEYDKTLEAVEYSKIIETLDSAIIIMKNFDKRVKPTRGFFIAQSSEVSVANSSGGSGQRKGTNIMVWMRTKAQEAGMESTGNEHHEARFWKEIDFEGLSRRAAEKAVKFLKAKPIPSTKAPVIFTNQVFASILGILLGPAASADWVQKGRSPLADKLKKDISSSNVSVVDDGTMKGGWNTSGFDDEGYPTQTTPLIEKGVLKNYLYDSYTALKGDAKSTGNAQRQAYWMKPQPAATNLMLKTGDCSQDEIIAETKRGIFIDGTIGEWLSNPVSGNLNATVSHGYMVRNGKIAEPIKGVVISGSFYDLLKSGIELVGNDLRNSAQYYSPTVKVKELTIAGS
jgi:PmbA protein